MVLKVSYSVLFIGPRRDCWRGAPRTIGVCELPAVGHLEPWTFLDFFVGKGD